MVSIAYCFRIPELPPSRSGPSRWCRAARASRSRACSSFRLPPTCRRVLTTCGQPARWAFPIPRAFMVGHLQEVVEEPNNNHIEKPMRVTLESIVNGQSNGGAADFFKFTARQGQRVMLDVWAERIDSRMDATLLVYDAAGREIARSRDVNGRDPLVDLSIPADGDYVVMLYDFLYQAGSEFPYRLVISTEPYVDFVFPPAGPPQTKAGHFTVFGRNLPGRQAGPLAQIVMVVRWKAWAW